MRPKSPIPPASESPDSGSAGRRSSLGRSLVLLVLACLAPAVVVAAVLVAENWRLRLGGTHERTVLLARDFRSALDRELARVEAGLEVLATSPDLLQGNLSQFHRVASGAIGTQIIYNYILTGPGGRMVLNTLVPYGQPLPESGTPPALEAVFTTRKPVLTDWFIGPVTGKPALALGVPVVDARGQVLYSLNVGISPGRLGEILARQALPDRWVATILDGSGTILARTRDPDTFVGKKAVAEVLRQLTLRDEGSLEALTVDGVPAVTAFSRSAAWPWSVAIGAPKAALEAELLLLVTWVSLGAALAYLLGLGLAARLARRVTVSVRGLNDAALALVDGRPVRLPAVQWHEAEAIGKALVHAGQIMAREHHRATHDPLTGLANRALFEEMLRHEFGSAERSGQGLAVVSLDLDGFKGVNDEFGHGAGDEVLRTVASRIRRNLRTTDTAARLGGDEFAVVLGGCDRASALVMAGRLVGCLAEPYPLVGAAVSASAGVAVYPESGRTMAALLESSDRALYRAKESGKRCVGVEP